MNYQVMLRGLLDPDDTQPRRSRDAEGIRELADSIRDHGILQPLIVFENGKRYKIADGHRRFEGACLLDLKEVPVLVLSTKPDADTLLLTQLAANLMRENIKPTEKAQAYQRLKEMRGLSNVDLAKLMHVSKSAVTETLSYLELSAEAQALLDSGQIAGSTAYTISRAPDEATRQELLSKAVRGELRREDAARKVSRAKSGRTPRQHSTFRLPMAEISVAANEELDFASLIGLFQKLGRECRRAERQGINVKTFERVLIDRSQNGLRRNGSELKAESHLMQAGGEG